MILLYKRLHLIKFLKILKYTINEYIHYNIYMLINVIIARIAL